MIARFLTFLIELILICSPGTLRFILAGLIDLESVPKAYAVVRLRGRLYRNRSRYFAPVSRRSIN